MTHHIEASEPKWVIPVLDIIGVNSLRLGGLHIINNNHIIKKKKHKNHEITVRFNLVIVQPNQHMPNQSNSENFNLIKERD